MKKVVKIRLTEVTIASILHLLANVYAIWFSSYKYNLIKNKKLLSLNAESCAMYIAYMNFAFEEGNTCGFPFIMLVVSIFIFILY